MTIYIALYPKALRRFTIKVKSKNNFVNNHILSQSIHFFVLIFLLSDHLLQATTFFCTKGGRLRESGLYNGIFIIFLTFGLSFMTWSQNCQVIV